MGCGKSAPVRPRPRPRQGSSAVPIREDGEEECEAPHPIDREAALKEFTAAFLTTVGKIHQPPNMTAAVALTRKAVPLMVGPLFLNGSVLPISFSAPTIVVGIAERGRVLFLGNFAILSGTAATGREGEMFLELVSRYLGGEDRMQYRALICDWPGSAPDALKRAFASVDVAAELGNERLSASKYQFVIVTTEYSDVGAVETYLMSDGGVVVCGMGKPVGIAMRVLLEKYGIGIPQTSTTVGDLDRTISGEPAKPGFALPRLIERIIKKSGDPAAHSGPKIDRIITALRFHILALTGQSYAELEPLFVAAWEMLEATGGGYLPGVQTVCPTVIHAMLAMLIADLLPRVTPALFQNVDSSMPFPGRCDLETDSYHIHVDFLDISWVSTGLYLLPGVMATVETNHEVRGLWLQAGAHTWTNFQRQGPWKRFPGVTVRMSLVESTCGCCSPFGGIIYVGCDGDCPNGGCDMTFHNVAECPMYSGVNEALSTDTGFRTAPWGEIETRFAIFTVPASVFSSSLNLRLVCERMDAMLGSLLKFLADQSISPYRIVFDVEIGPVGSGPEYPVFMPIEIVETALAVSEPSETIFQLLIKIARLSFPPSELHNEIRDAVLALAVYGAEATIWPDQAEAISLMMHISSRCWCPFL
jgi:hypothetical protein